MEEQPPQQKKNTIKLNRELRTLAKPIVTRNKKRFVALQSWNKLNKKDLKAATVKTKTYQN